MSDLPVIQADFCTFRHVQGRKVLQLTFEVVAEDAEKALRVLGMPRVGENTWCAIALLKAETQTAPAEPSAAAPTKEHRKFSELPLPQQAGIRCQDKDFHWFLMDVYPAIAAQNSEPKAIVCQICGVDTRSELVHGEPSGDKWHALEARYQSWLTDRKFAEARR